MYCSFYGMKRKPFENSVNLDIYYSSPQHEEAWEFITQGIRSREQYLLLLGDYGVGKSTLATRLDEAMAKNGRIAYRVVPNPNCSSRAVLRLIASAFLPDGELASLSEEEIQDRMITFFQEAQRIRPVYVIFDDVHEADSHVTLPKLFSVSKITARGLPVIRWLFFAHSSFTQILQSRELQPLDQRIRRRFFLENFTLTHTKEYIYFRLYRAGAVGVPRFTPEAIQKIYDYSAGVPRLINNACDMALEVGASMNSMVIDGSIVAKALERMLPSAGFAITPPQQAKSEVETAHQETYTVLREQKDRESPQTGEKVELKTENLIDVTASAAHGEKTARKIMSFEKIIMITLAGSILLALILIALRLYHVV